MANIPDLSDLREAAAYADEGAAAGNVDEEVDRQKHPSGIVPVLQNVVATVNLGCQLDLKQIALHARNAEYNPKRFAAVIMRIREPKTTALIFASGKMVCTGAKSEEDSRLAARKYCRIVQKLGFDAEFKEFKIQNIVGSCDVKFPIRLEGLSFTHGYFATYEPEIFPGLIYRMKQPKIVLLIFVSGKVVLTGAKTRDDIYLAFENIYATLQQFKKSDAAAQLAGAMAPPALPAPAGDGAGPSGQASMPPPGQARSMLPPAPSLPPATPAHPGLPPSTPAWQPNSTHIPPATPLVHNIPPATPAHGGLGGVIPATPAWGGSGGGGGYMPPSVGDYMPPPMQAPAPPASRPDEGGQ